MLKKITLLAVIVVAARAAYAAPILITACRDITNQGAYQLANNLNAAGNCLVLKASGVAIDLNGFVIAGNGTGAGITDAGVQRLNVTIRNGAIQQFNTAIDLSHSQVIAIEQVTVTNNHNGIMAGPYATVSDSFIGFNTATGTLLGNFCAVRDNRVNNNSGSVGIDGGDYCSIIGNNASGNQVNVAIAAGRKVLVKQNNASNNAGIGIQVQDGSTVADNVASFDGILGIEGNFNTTIARNTTSFGKKDGIQTGGGSVVYNNTASSNVRIGFFINCPTNLIGNSAHANPTGNFNLVVFGGANCTSYNNF